MLLERYEYIRSILNQLFHIEIIILTSERILLSGCKAPSYQMNVLLKKLDAQYILGAKYQIIMIEENIYFGIVPLKNDQICIVGPIGGENLSEKQLWNYQRRFRVRQDAYRMSRHSILKIDKIIDLTGYILNETSYRDEKTIRFDKEDVQEHDLINHQIQNGLEERARFTYQYEQQYFQMIENGEADKIYQIISDENNAYPIDALQKVGTVAKDSDFKQMEYLTVTAVALASRAAIRGNARPDVCYDLSDLFLQRISVAKDIMEIYELSRQVLYRFAKEVEKEKKLRGKNPVVEQCKNYIAKHLYSKFTIEKMAEDLSVSRTYLSGIFKKATGSSIRDYILEQRVRAAANLLRYSNESIGNIAGYMQFSSVSRFSIFFKRYYGMTPAEYRKQNKLIEFEEKNK